MTTIAHTEETVTFYDALLAQRWEQGMQDAGAVPMRHTTPIRRYATYQPDWTSPYIQYGIATLYRQCGYVFQADGTDTYVMVRYNDVRLVCGQLVEA